MGHEASTFFFCSRHATEIVRSDNSSATLGPDVVDARLNGYAGFHHQFRKAIPSLVGGRDEVATQEKREIVSHLPLLSFPLPARRRRNFPNCQAVCARTLSAATYDILIHGGVFLLLLAPISQPAFFGTPCRTRFGASSPRRDSAATGKFEPSQGRPSFFRHEAAGKII